MIIISIIVINIILYIYIYIYITLSKARRLDVELEEGETREPATYTRSPLEDSRLFGPSPWKILRHYL